MTSPVSSNPTLRTMSNPPLTGPSADRPIAQPFSNIGALLIQAFEVAKEGRQADLQAMVNRIRQNNDALAALRNERAALDATEVDYKDDTAGAAIEQLRSNPGEISGEAMKEAIFYATYDLDASAAGNEFDDLKAFVDANSSRMSPEAMAAWNKYKNLAESYKAQGKSGIPKSAYDNMLSDMGFSRPATLSPPKDYKAAQSERLAHAKQIDSDIQSLSDVGDELRTQLQLFLQNYEDIANSQSNSSKKLDNIGNTQIGNMK